MDEIRKGQIAVALVRYWASRKGIWLTPDLKGNLGNIAKETGASQDELKEFVKALFEEILEETFK